jgi:hypothetical protein
MNHEPLDPNSYVVPEGWLVPGVIISDPAPFLLPGASTMPDDPNEYGAEPYNYLRYGGEEE